MISLFFRNLFFTILQPGIVAGLVPFVILQNVTKESSKELAFYHYSGIFLFAIGLVLMLTCITNFAIKGRGTLSPADPTKKLVTTGPYSFSRNPMYMGVMLILTGESNFFSII
jgi:protein-S-isoprenylcysteine O-methyltransferase Ste14